MRIIVICKGHLEALPPVMSVCLVARDAGYQVTVLTGHSLSSTRAEFAHRGIQVCNLFPDNERVPVGLLRKTRHWIAFARRAWKHLESNQQDALLWLGSADTALALGPRVSRWRYVLQLHELYDRDPLYRRKLKRFARQASCVVVPDFSRACIFRSWYDLETTPVVVPNKPAAHPRINNLEIQDGRALEALATVEKGERLVLYQGGIRPYSELKYVAEAVQQLGTGWRFVVMGSGSNEYRRQLQRDYSNLLFIPRISPPRHLQVTSHAYIGIVTYSYECLNFVFCAPNKTWEFAGFGVPMICNDLPTLRSEIQANGTGICVDIQQSEAIASGLSAIDRDYETFHLNANRFYDSVDITASIRAAIRTGHEIEVNNCSHEQRSLRVA